MLGIVGAMDEEVQLLQNQMTRKKETVHAGITVVRGKFKGVEFVCFGRLQKEPAPGLPELLSSHGEDDPAGGKGPPEPGTPQESAVRAGPYWVTGGPPAPPKRGYRGASSAVSNPAILSSKNTWFRVGELFGPSMVLQY